MKNVTAGIIALIVALSLCACSGRNGTSGAQDTEPSWHYGTESEERSQSYTDDDGTVIATTSYTLPRLSVLSEGMGAVPPEAQKACDTFNEEIRRTSFIGEGFFGDGEEPSDFSAMAREAHAWSAEMGMEFEPFFDEFSVSDVFQSAHMLSVFGLGSSFTGGAHPNNYFIVWNYDLDNGKFFGLNDLSDDPEALRAAVAENILGQINEQGLADGYFEDYAATIREAKEFSVMFRDSQELEVWFSEYEIAPHAAGMPNFTIPYPSIASYLNSYGRTLMDLA